MKRAIITVRADLIERMLQLPEGVNIRSINANWMSDSIDIMIEGDTLPTYTEYQPGMVPANLGMTTKYTDDGRIKVEW